MGLREAAQRGRYLDEAEAEGWAVPQAVEEPEEVWWLAEQNPLREVTCSYAWSAS